MKGGSREVPVRFHVLAVAVICLVWAPPMYFYWSLFKFAKGYFYAVAASLTAAAFLPLIASRIPSCAT